LFALAPIFDLRAPALYIEGVQVILAILLSVYLRKKLGKKSFYYWCIFVVLLLAPVFLRPLGMPPRYQRWLLLFLSLSSIAYGITVWKMLDEKVKKYKMILVTGFVYTVFA
uniref:hypothetical protein n=1 Tax=Pseudomonas viridiflava TaxID=33069 RepID=UPI00197EA7D1